VLQTTTVPLPLITKVRSFPRIGIIFMSQRLKSWESPRHEGRNDKGKGGSARQRQKKKQLQMLRKKLRAGINQKGDNPRAISFLINA
jgi:hypothetical protein